MAIKMIRRHFLFLVIFITAFFLRAQEVLTNNYLFLLDQGRDMMAVKKIVFYHDLVFIGPNTSLAGVFQGPLYYYLLAPFTFVLNGDPLGAMITMLMVSLLVIVVVYFFFLRYFGKTHALIASYLFAISPEAVSAATYIWNPHSMWLLIVLTIIFMYITVAKSEKFHFLLWPTILLTFHFQMAFGVFLFIAVLGYFLLKQRAQLTSHKFRWGVLLAALLLIPQVLFDLRNNFLMSKSVLKVLTGGNDQGLFANSEQTGYTVLMNGHLGTLVNNFKSAFPQFEWYQAYPGIITITILIGSFLYYKTNTFSKQEKTFVRLLSIVILLIITLTFVYPFPLRYWFLTGFQSFYLLLTAVVIATMMRGKKMGKLIAIILIIITIPYTITRLNKLYVQASYEPTHAKIQGKQQAFDYIYQDANGEPFGLLVFNPPVLTDPYDYILFWYAAPKYGYTPHKEKKGLVYLLMEPDPGKPWSYKGWLETVIVDGEVLDEITLPSGIIVQKRMFQ